MKKFLFTCLASMSLFAIPILAQAQSQTQTQTQTNEPQTVMSEQLKVSGTVQSVSAWRRMVTLKDTEGNIVRLRFGKEAPDLSQLHKGDPVTATYMASAVLALRKPGEEPTGAERQEYAISSEKGAPGGMIVNSIQTSATIEDVNPAKRRITLKWPDGRTVTMKVDPRVQNLEQLKKGDQIFVKYTEAAGVSVAKSQS